MYLRTKIQVSSIILTRFRQGVILSPPPHHHHFKQIPKKPTQIRVTWNTCAMVFYQNRKRKLNLSVAVTKSLYVAIVSTSGNFPCQNALVCRSNILLSQNNHHIFVILDKMIYKLIKKFFLFWKRTASKVFSFELCGIS